MSAVNNEKSSPMDTQVGGSHYKNLPIQPAVFWIKNNLPATQGAIVKYLTRHRSANGRQDLEKAIHFIEMLLLWHFDAESGARIIPATWKTDFIWRIKPEVYAEENKLPESERAAIILVCTFYCRDHLTLAKRIIEGIIALEYPVLGEAQKTTTGRDQTKREEWFNPEEVSLTGVQSLHVAINRLQQCNEYLNKLALLNPRIKSPEGPTYSVFQYNICHTMQLLRRSLAEIERVVL